MIWTWLTARAAWIGAIAVAIMAAVGLIRRDARRDERAVASEEDRNRAEQIRDRVDRARPRRLSDDDRGYRD